MNWKFIGIALAVLLAGAQVALIGAKLLGHIHCSWWLVMTPLWAPVALFVVGVILAIAMFSNASSNGENPFQ